MRKIDQAMKVNETAMKVLKVLKNSELDESGIQAALAAVDTTLADEFETEECEFGSGFSPIPVPCCTCATEYDTEKEEGTVPAPGTSEKEEAEHEEKEEA